MKEAHKKASRRKTLMEQELKNLKGEKMRMYEEYAAGTLPLDTYKQKNRNVIDEFQRCKSKLNNPRRKNPLRALCREPCAQRQSRQKTFEWNAAYGKYGVGVH